ncbi:MAG: T9SS type A sorting domain-containing protein, partial [Bacteroidota bacterium]
SNGLYTTSLLEGNNGIKLYTDLPPFWEYTTDSIRLVMANETSETFTGLDIGVSPIPGITDASVVLSALTPVRPGFEARYKLNYSNNLNQILAGQVTLVQHENLNFVEATPSPDYIFGDTLIWDYDNLAPGEAGSILINNEIEANTELIGDPIALFALISPLEGDTIKANNQDTLHQIITGSYDPNDIQIFPSCVDLNFPQTDQFFEYKIRFQNLGSDTAFNVLVVDDLPDSLNLSTLEFIDSSHPTALSFTNGSLKFFFEDIQLPHAEVDEPGSHGFVRFKIKPYDTVERVDQIFNKAAIYFDYNPPIITNEVFPSIISIIEESITSCLPVSSASGNQIWENSGTYLDTLLSPASGCFQEILVEFTRIDTEGELYLEDQQLVYDVPNLQYQWFDCSTDEDILEANLQQFRPASLGSYAVRVSFDGDCIMESSCYTVDSSFDVDQDGDGFFEWADCNDTLANINPIALDIPNNGIDENCDGVDLITSVRELEHILIKIYPNPVTDQLNIRLSEPLQYTVRITDMQGRLLGVFENQDAISMEFVPSGIYLVEIVDDKMGWTVSKKIIVEH